MNRNRYGKGHILDLTVDGATSEDDNIVIAIVAAGVTNPFHPASGAIAL